MTSLSTKPSQAEVTVSPTTPPPAKPPLSRWWPIGLLTVWPVLIVIGALLLGVGLSEFDGTPSTMAYAPMVTGGYACIGLGLAVKVAFWAMVIKRHRQQRRFPTPPIERPLSKWWLIGLSIPAIALIAAGAPLLGLGLSSFDSFDTRVPNGPSYTKISGGLACLAIGLAVMIAFWAVVVVRQRQRQRARHTVPSAGVYVNSGAPAAMPAPGSGRQQSSPSTAELSGQQQPAHSTAELSGQHLLELSPTSTPAVPPRATADPSAQHVPQPYGTAPQARASPPISTAAELPMPASPVELPTETSEKSATALPASHPFPQHLFSSQKEVAPPAEKEPVAKFCRYCGAALDLTTQLCGQCGI